MNEALPDSVGHSFDLSVFIREELQGEILVKLPTVLGIDLSITKDILMMWIAAILLVILGYFAARRREAVPRRWQNLFEMLVIRLQKDAIAPFLGDETRRFTPFLLTLFFFILANNLMGIIPGATKATANISVTTALAGVTFLVVHISGLRQYGFGGYLCHLMPPGLPKVLLPIMIPVELLSMLTKPFALAMRLFANMTAGHIVIAALMGLIFLFRNWALVPLSVLGAVGVSLLEILIDFIQAYIFTLLSAAFIGIAIRGEN